MAKPVILQPGLLQVKAQYTPNPDTGDHPENVMWFQSSQTTQPSIQDLTTIAQTFDRDWAQVWQHVGAAGHQYLGSVWTDFSTAFGNSYTSVGTFPPASSGLGGAPLPSNVAVLISYEIQERYKGGHGRSYLPWISSQVQLTTDYNEISATVAAAIVTSLGALQVDMAATGVHGGQRWFIYRKKQDPVNAHLVVVNGFKCSTTFASQRRRLRKAPHK